MKNSNDLKTVRELHDRAMALAQLALVARHHGLLKQAQILTYRAVEHEFRAANLVPEDQSSEPTRSILYRSAASLAYQCGNLSLAKQLIAKESAACSDTQAQSKDLFQHIKDYE